MLECAGHPRALESAVTATRTGGRTVTVGLPAPDAKAEVTPPQINEAMDELAEGKAIRQMIRF